MNSATKNIIWVLNSIRYNRKATDWWVIYSRLLVRLGFDERIKGSHYIFTRNDVAEIINLQPKGNKAKQYQVKQVRGILVKYKLGETHVD